MSAFSHQKSVQLLSFTLCYIQYVCKNIVIKALAEYLEDVTQQNFVQFIIHSCHWLARERVILCRSFLRQYLCENSSWILLFSSVCIHNLLISPLYTAFFSMPVPRRTDYSTRTPALQADSKSTYISGFIFSTVS